MKRAVPCRSPVCRSSGWWPTTSSVPPGATAAASRRVEVDHPAVGQVHELRGDQVPALVAVGLEGADVEVPPLGALADARPRRVRAARARAASVKSTPVTDQPRCGEPDAVGALAAADVERPSRREVGGLGRELRVDLSAPDRVAGRSAPPRRAARRSSASARRTRDGASGLLLDEVGVDPSRRRGARRGRGDHRAIGVVDVAGDPEAGYGGGAGRLGRDDRPEDLAVHLERHRPRPSGPRKSARARKLGRDHDGLAREHRAGGQPQPDQRVASARTSGGVPSATDADGAQPLESSSGGSAPSCTTDHVVGQLAEQQRLVRGHRRGREDDDGLVAHLPAVAVGAVQDVAAPPLGQAGHVGQLVADPGGDEHAARPTSRPPSVVTRKPVGRRRTAPTDAVGEPARRTAPPRRGRSRAARAAGALPAQVVVRVARGGVARAAGVDRRAPTAGTGPGPSRRSARLRRRRRPPRRSPLVLCVMSPSHAGGSARH